MKKFDYIYAWQSSIITFVILAPIILLLPNIEQNVDLTIVLTISTFLFGIIAAFAISERYSRFQDLRKLVSAETSSLSFIYITSVDIDKNYSEKLRKLIDDYLIASMQYELHNYEDELQLEFNTLEKAINQGRIFIKDGKPELFNKLMDSLVLLNKTRNEISLLGKDKMEKVQWLTLISLSFVTILSTIFILNTNIFTRSLAVIFCFTIILILLILRDLNNDRWHKESISISPFTEVWDVLGLPHYFMKVDIDTKRVILQKGTKYRIGYNNPGEKADIRFIDGSTNI